MSDQKNTSHDAAIGMFWIGVFLFAVGMLVWFFYEEIFKDAYRWLRWAEMWVISYFVGEDLVIPAGQDRLSFWQWFTATPVIPVENLDAATIRNISFVAMEPLRIPFVIIISLMGIWSIRSGPGTHYRDKFSLDGLIEIQSKNFPYIAPFIKFNPAKMAPRPPGAPVPAELPLFAEALGPEEWLAYNQIPVPDGEIDEHATFIAFARQLGPRWRGPSNLPPYKQVLLAAFCLKAARKRSESDDMLGRIALCWDHEKGLRLNLDKKLLKDAQNVLKNKDMSGATLARCNQHAFQNTALLRALETAREEGGVLAASQFVWLRGFDRHSWYPLNSLGRQAFYMEAIGAMTHYIAEKRTQRPIPKPKMEEAVGSIVDYMASDKARPIPQLQYNKGSTKRGVKKPKKQGVKAAKV